MRFDTSRSFSTIRTFSGNGSPAKGLTAVALLFEDLCGERAHGLRGYVFSNLLHASTSPCRCRMSWSLG